VVGEPDEERVIALQYVAPDGSAESEKRMHYGPPAGPGQPWGPIYRVDYYEQGKLLAIREYREGRISRAKRYDAAGNLVVFDNPEGAVFGSWGDRYEDATGAVWHKQTGDDSDRGWVRGELPAEADDAA
jgi:hypothetical protein